jgi:hypothetical protein
MADQLKQPNVTPNPKDNSGISARVMRGVFIVLLR